MGAHYQLYCRHLGLVHQHYPFFPVANTSDAGEYVRAPRPKQQRKTNTLSTGTTASAWLYSLASSLYSGGIVQLEGEINNNSTYAILHLLTLENRQKIYWATN